MCPSNFAFCPPYRRTWFTATCDGGSPTPPTSKHVAHITPPALVIPKNNHKRPSTHRDSSSPSPITHVKRQRIYSPSPEIDDQDEAECREVEEHVLGLAPGATPQAFPRIPMGKGRSFKNELETPNHSEPRYPPKNHRAVPIASPPRTPSVPWTTQFSACVLSLLSLLSLSLRCLLLYVRLTLSIVPNTIQPAVHAIKATSSPRSHEPRINPELRQTQGAGVIQPPSIIASNRRLTKRRQFKREAAEDLADALAMQAVRGPPRGPLPATIELQMQMASGSRHAFGKLFEHFNYEVDGAEVEDVFHITGPDSAKSPPGIEFHRLYWRGESKKVPEALTIALPSLLSRLSISNCSLSIQDVVSILSHCPCLEVLDVRQIADVTPVVPLSVPPAMLHNLSSLAITARVRLDPLFLRTRFMRLAHLSIRLFGAGNQTRFNFLDSFTNGLPNVRLRGDIDCVEERYIRERYYMDDSIDLDLGHLCKGSNGIA